MNLYINSTSCTATSAFLSLIKAIFAVSGLPYIAHTSGLRWNDEKTINSLIRRLDKSSDNAINPFVIIMNVKERPPSKVPAIIDSLLTNCDRSVGGFLLSPSLNINIENRTGYNRRLSQNNV